MTNHVHLLLTPRQERGCSGLMKNLGQRYVQAINRRWQRSGPLWEGRYKACLVDTNMYALNCQAYIERNPVRAGMVRHPAEYRWSSHRVTALGAPSNLITPHGAYVGLSAETLSRRLIYRALFEHGQPDSVVQEIRSAIQGGFAYGSPEFIERLSQFVGRRVARRNLQRVEVAA
jgi:putative transposase